MVTIALENPDQEAVLAFLRQADARSLALYPGADRSGPDPAALRAPGMRFFVARIDGRAVGCGGFALRPDGSAELKRIFVDPQTRGNGVGRQLVETIEAAASAAGVTRMQLETGIKSAEAIRLYRRLGYSDCPPFGAYGPDALSVFMEKRLHAGG